MHAESDYDFGVILSGKIESSWRLESEAKELAAEILNKKVDLCVVTRREIEYKKQLPFNIEAKILTGKVIIDTGKRAEVTGEIPSLETLKIDAAVWMMRACAINLSNSAAHEHDMSLGLMIHDVCLHSVRALCWALKAQLALKGVDTTDRTVRWDPVALTNLAIKRGAGMTSDITKSLSHIKDIEHLSQWIGENPTVDVALSLQTHAFLVPKNVAENMPKDALVGFLEHIERDIRMANEISHMNEPFSVDYASEYVNKGNIMLSWFGSLLLDRTVDSIP